MRLPLSKSLMLGWLLGLATVAIGAAAYGALTLAGVTFDTSASTPHSTLFARAMHMTMANSVRRRASGQEPPQAARAASLVRGAEAYQRDCAACHGGPGAARAHWASAMLPTPPFLLDMRTHWTHDQLYKLIRDGVKMSGMPAWGELEDAQTLSDLTLFVERLHEVRPDQFARIKVNRSPSDATEVARSIVRPVTRKPGSRLSE